MRSGRVCALGGVAGVPSHKTAPACLPELLRTTVQCRSTPHQDDGTAQGGSCTFVPNPEEGGGGYLTGPGSSWPWASSPSVAAAAGALPCCTGARAACLLMCKEGRQQAGCTTVHQGWWAAPILLLRWLTHTRLHSSSSIGRHQLRAGQHRCLPAPQLAWLPLHWPVPAVTAQSAAAWRVERACTYL